MKRIVFIIGFTILVLASGTGCAMMGAGMMGGGLGGTLGGAQRGPIVVGDAVMPREIMMDIMQMMKGMMAIQKDLIKGMIDTEKEQNLIKLSGMMRDLDGMMASINAAQ